MKHDSSSRPPFPAFGVDIGRVLMCPTHDDGRPDTSFLASAEHDALEIPPSPLAFEVVAELVSFAVGRLWLVSKAGPRIERLTRRWLAHHRFFERAGLPADHVRFCRRREDKRLYASELGLSHFIDDRTDVLQHLRGVVPELYLFGVQAAPAPAWVVPVADWLEVRERVLPS